MLNFEENLYDNSNNYVQSIQEWTLRRYHTIPFYHVEKYSFYFEPTFNLSVLKSNTCMSVINKGKPEYRCYIKLGNFDYIFEGFGKSKSAARKDAFEYLEKHNLLLSIRDEIEKPNKNEAINQLEILARRGYFSILIYDFEETYDQDGNPIWNCTCVINEKDISFNSYASKKKEAKKNSAFKMLKYVLENSD